MARYLALGSLAKAAADLGVSNNAIRQHVMAEGLIPAKQNAKCSDGVGYEVGPLPGRERSIEEILAYRKGEFERVENYEEAHRLVSIKMSDDKPIALAHFGDPHVDDPGADIQLLPKNLEVLRATEGMFGVNVGDYQNNWIGRLAEIYADHGITASESWKLVEWMIEYPKDAKTGQNKWMYLVGGNHDAWSGQRDPLAWIAKQAGSRLKYHGVRFQLVFPNGRKVRVNCRHDFRGHSMWNPVHAIVKAAKFGERDHILSCGHRHIGGYMPIAAPELNGRISHCIRVASYKIYDGYANKLGLDSHFMSPCMVTVIDPCAKTEVELVHVDFSIERAAEWVTWLRGRK